MTARNVRTLRIARHGGLPPWSSVSGPKLRCTKRRCACGLPTPSAKIAGFFCIHNRGSRQAGERELGGVVSTGYPSETRFSAARSSSHQPRFFTYSVVNVSACCPRSVNEYQTPS